MSRFLFALSLLLLGHVAVAATPLESAQARARATFEQKNSAQFDIDPAILNARWQTVPFDQKPYMFTFKEIELYWDRFMRGLRIPYPSPAYLKDRYARYPRFMHTLGYQDNDWEQHSLNVLETWQAYMRGDFQHAYNLGKKYGGYALIPAIFGEILQGVYLARTNEEKQTFLQDAINNIQQLSEQMPILPSEEGVHEEYVLMRLGYAYAVARLAEDAPVAKTLTAGYAPAVINSATEALAVDSDHPLTLALNAAFDANVIRRVGKGMGRITFGAQPINAEADFNKAIGLAGDMAIIRYEYANSLLYIGKDEEAANAMKQLQAAAAMTAGYSMEALDVLYARKRLVEVRSWQDSGISFGKFDRKRRKYMERTGENLYSVVSRPFLVN